MLEFPVDAWNNPEFKERVLDMAASWKNSAYIENTDMHNAAIEKMRPHITDILYAIELILRKPK